MWPFVGAELRNYREKKLAAINLSAFVTAWNQTRPSVGRRVWNDDEEAEYPQPARQIGNKALGLRNSQQNLTVRHVND